MKTLITILSALLLISCSKDKSKNCEDCTYIIFIEAISEEPMEVNYDFLNFIIPAEYDKCLFLDTADVKNIPWYKGRSCK